MVKIDKWCNPKNTIIHIAHVTRVAWLSLELSKTHFEPFIISEQIGRFKNHFFNV